MNFEEYVGFIDRFVIVYDNEEMLENIIPKRTNTEFEILVIVIENRSSRVRTFNVVMYCFIEENTHYSLKGFEVVENLMKFCCHMNQSKN